MFRLTVVALSVVCFAFAGVNCGEVNDDRIVNGRDASILEFNYQGSLQERGSHFCGCSLLNTNWILTAAHCIYGLEDGNSRISDMSVRMGSSDWASGGTVRNLLSLFSHPSHNRKSMSYDVGVGQLATPVQLSGVIQPVQLLSHAIPTGVDLIVSGWGHLEENASSIPRRLQCVLLKYLSQDACSQRKYSYGRSIDDSMICATGPGKDSCQGDSGGPLCIPGTNTQIGVVSFGIGCGRPEYPGVYCDLRNPKVLSFIKTYVKGL